MKPLVMEKSNKPKVIIVGGGAAGFYTAIQLAEMAKGHFDIHILEKTSKLLSKVSVSGGGRCNVTNILSDTHLFAKQYPRGEKVLKKLLYHYKNTDVVAWFKSKGVQLVAEEDGRMFPSTNTSATIVSTFLDAAVKHKISIHTSVKAAQIAKQARGFELQTSQGIMYCDYVVIASGGYAKPEMFSWMQPCIAAEHIVAPVPSLFSFNVENKRITTLQGITIPDVQIKLVGNKKLQTKGPVLITHWGLSGPAILKMSAWGALILEKQQYVFDILINWIPDYDEDAMIALLMTQQQEHPTRKVANKNPLGLPARFWEYLLAQADIDLETTWANNKAKNRNVLAKLLCAMPLAIKGKTTFKEEFVTAGGIDTAQIQLQTMEYKHCPHLFVVGEALNIDGITGGFNFQNAWSTAYTAAAAIAQKQLASAHII